MPGSHRVRVTLRGIAVLATWIQARVQHGKGKFATL